MENLSHRDKINNYKILCGIIPHYEKTKYPYSHWSTKKITETGKLIKIDNSKKGGGTATILIF